ncbi:MAG: sulfurtransferase [Gammaproteobacteria bacterium]|nr:sulfurtransferase [Gammaproteobacteria bacterium]
MTYATVITASELEQHIARPDWVVFDCRFNLADPQAGQSAYQAGHLPGARYAHLDNDLSSPVGSQTGRHPLPEPAALAVWLGACGVEPDSQVVAYDAQGSAIASRLWWLLRWLGHEAVAVLDGGFQAWCDAGYALQTEVPAARDTGAYPLAVNNEMSIGAEELAKKLAEKRVRLLDARAPVRFRGDKEPLDKVAGHVPGAVNHSFSDDMDDTGKYLAAAELRAHLASVVEPFSPAETVCMCGSGVTACHTLLAMEIAGLSGARLYAGSWSEWITDPQRPVATGE